MEDQGFEVRFIPLVAGPDGSEESVTRLIDGPDACARHACPRSWLSRTARRSDGNF
jgi:hypothetical protein